MPNCFWSCQFSLRIRLSSETSASCFNSPAQNDSNAFFSSRPAPIRGKPRFVAIAIVRLLVQSHAKVRGFRGTIAPETRRLSFFKVVARVRKSVHLDANYGYSVPPSTPGRLRFAANQEVRGAGAAAFGCFGSATLFTNTIRELFQLICRTRRLSW